MPPYRSGKWIHDRAHHLLPDLESRYGQEGKSVAYAIATQQAHKLGKTLKGYGTAEGRQEANAKYGKPRSTYVKTADPVKKASADGGTGMNLSIQELIESAVADARGQAEKTASVRTPTRPAEARSVSIDHKEALKVAAALDLIRDNLSDVIDDRPLAEKLAEYALLTERLKLAGEDIPVTTPMGEGLSPGAPGTAMALVPSSDPNTPGMALRLPEAKSSQIPDSTQNNEAGSDGNATTMMETDEEDPPGSVSGKTAAYKHALIQAITKRASVGSATRLAQLKSKLAMSPLAGGTTVGEGVPEVPEGETGIGSGDEAINFTRRQADQITKKRFQALGLLSEPMVPGTEEPVLGQLLDHSTGEKLSAAKAYLMKVAGDGCSCGHQGRCVYCSVKTKVASIMVGEDPAGSADPAQEAPQGLTSDEYADVLRSLEG